MAIPTPTVALRALQQRTGLTGPGLAVLLGAVVALVIGRRIDNPGLGLVGVLGVLFVIGTRLVTGRRVVLRATRDRLPGRVRAGRVVEGGFELGTDRSVRGVTVRERFPAALGADISVALPVITRDAPVEHSYRFEATHRGVYTIGPLTAELADPFGLVRRRRELAPVTTVIVHPRTERVLDRITARRWEDPVLRPPRSLPWPTGAEYYGMSEYQPGDDPRRIVWSAVARLDTLLVREAEQGISDRVSVLLDTHTDSYEDDTVAASFETAVRVAASVACSHLLDGFSVAVETGEATLMTRCRGRARQIELLDALAGVNRGSATVRDIVNRLLLDRTADGHFVLITSTLDAATAQAMQLFCRSGRSLLTVVVLNDRTDAATLRHAAALRSPVVEVAGDDALRRPFDYALGIGAHG